MAGPRDQSDARERRRLMRARDVARATEPVTRRVVREELLRALTDLLAPKAPRRPTTTRGRIAAWLRSLASQIER